MIVKQNIASFIRCQKLKQLLIRVILMTYLNQSVVRLYETYKNFFEKIWIGLLIQS